MGGGDLPLGRCCDRPLLQHRLHPGPPLEEDEEFVQSHTGRAGSVRHTLPAVGDAGEKKLT